MKLFFDEPKRLANLINRGLDFADLDIDFFAEATVVSAKEDRFKAVGMFHGAVLAVIFKPLGSEALSIISMRRANRKERSIYGQSQIQN
jgi:uncharacterized protein